MNQAAKKWFVRFLLLHAAHPAMAASNTPLDARELWNYLGSHRNNAFSMPL
ncbi:hypothetical protein PAMC26510_35570 [Caballeronia sordidicola]|uniref:Uncharacterized protein n=1 Tax=Caballeronia sordidicola TaxID=196367 RepID=A0A242M5B9_CABSO|nr:hypothetical protein PAMC26510_35570 [Caballeronia sordidicola]